MFARATFILVAVFWVTMNVLLWRAEYGQRRLLGGEMPVEVVWQKVLIAQDASPLEIRHHGKRIGFCRWAASIREAQAPIGAAAAALPEGMIRKPIGYRIDFDGNANVSDLPARLRFDSRAEFSTNHEWKEFHLRLNLHPAACEIHATAADETLWFMLSDGATQTDQAFKFSELNDPKTLLQQLVDPFSATVLDTGELLSGPQRPRVLASSVKCEARNDWIKIGRTSVRAYRLDIRLTDCYRAAIFVSRVGEILRVELPGDLTLVNDQVTNF